MSSHLLKVFVYGTLKNGQPNYHLLNNIENGFSKFVAIGKTSQKFPLVVGTRYNIPFLINRPGIGNHVVGEIYSIDEKMFARLDVLEDYPEFYDREIQDIDIEDGKEKLKCWVYLLKNFPEKLLNLPHIAEYKNSAEKRYQERCQRVSNILAKDDLEYGVETD
ncbi:CLUMA_CG013230, isoform A [Clunio marinus]|uniref:Gamma-glutamylcyclotransferase family protein n=1 Tax=Clunio marinus TaxID=568069 RepID=A0A1J1IJJ0_9DIPT|nr:CLUMA_CG013230, isoform A [Clunio marinus]